MVIVAARAASVAGVLAGVAITATFRRVIKRNLYRNGDAPAQVLAALGMTRGERDHRAHVRPRAGLRSR
jgi:hypothetical protein